MSKNICQFCGDTLDKNDIFCKGCGAKIEKDEDVKDAIIESDKKLKKETSFFLVLIVLLLLVITTVGFFLLFK